MSLFWAEHLSSQHIPNIYNRILPHTTFDIGMKRNLNSINMKNPFSENRHYPKFQTFDFPKTKIVIIFAPFIGF